MKYRVLNEKESFAVWLQEMPDAEREAYMSLKHNRAEPIFIDRVFYIYKCEGKGSDGKQRAPTVLAMIRVINFAYTLDKGFMVSLLNETTNEKQILTGVPTRVFGYDVFACVPTSFTLRFNQLLWENGKTQFDTSIAIYVKTSNKADFFSYRTVYIESPKRMAELYPLLDWAPDRQ